MTRPSKVGGKTMDSTEGGPPAVLSRSAVIRPGRPTVRTTFQFLGTLTAEGAQSLDELERDARSAVCDWLQAKYPEQLPSAARTGDPFETGVHGQRLECAVIPEDGLWSVRLEQPDAPFGDHAPVPGRSWTTEVVLSRSATAVRFGIRVLCASLGYADEPITPTQPRIVRDLAENFTLREAFPIRPRAWQPQTEADLLLLYDLLRSPERGLPVYLLTAPDERQLHMRVAPFLLNHERLASRTLGLAYVVTMPRDLGFRWTELVGKPWSAFWGAVRTYRPGLDFDADPPTDHPLMLAERILAFQYRDRKMEEAFELLLRDRAFEHSAVRHVDWGPCLFYVDARRRRAELSRSRAAEDSGWRALYEEELSALRAKIEQLEQERDDALSIAEAAEKERDTEREDNRKLRARVESLTRALAERTGQSPDGRVVLPDNYDEMPDWVDKHLAGRLVLHPRAVNRGLKDAQFERIEQVYRVLLLLANEYRDMCIGVPDAQERFNTRLEEMSLRYGPSISQEEAGKEGETYFVRYPYASSAKKFISHHIRSRAKARDPKRCLAVYFFWDDATQQVVVCWLPGHLDNRLT